MPRVKPEVIYEPLAPYIQKARENGATDDEIYAKIKALSLKAKEYGYTGGEIGRAINTDQIKQEANWRGIGRGVFKGLSQGYYVPDFLKQRPSEIEQPLYGTGWMGGLNPEAVGEIAGGVAPGVGATKLVGPLAKGLTKAIPGAAGALAQGTATGALSGALMGGTHADAEGNRLGAAGFGAALGGALGLGGAAVSQMQQARVQATPPPPKVLLPEASAADDIAVLRSPNAPEAPAVALPTQASKLPVPMDTPEIDAKITKEIEKIPVRQPITQQKQPGPLSPLPRPGVSEKRPTPPDLAEKGVQVESPKAQKLTPLPPSSGRPTSPRSAEKMSSRIPPGDIEEPPQGALKFPPAGPKTPTVGGEKPAPIGGAPLPEGDVPIPIQEALSAKGLKLQYNRADPKAPYEIIGAGGVSKKFDKLSDIVLYADSLIDDADTEIVNAAIRSRKVSKGDAAELRKMNKKPRVADAPMQINEGPQPPAPMPDRPPISGGSAPMVPQWAGPHLVNKSPRDASEFVNSVDQIVKTYPSMNQTLPESLSEAKFISWNPFDWVGQPTSSRNILIKTVAHEAVDVEMAWNYELKGWDTFYQKHFAKLTDAQSKEAAQLIEGQIKSASPQATKAAEAYKLAMQDFAERFGIPEWGEYVTRLTDRQALYDMWRPQLAGAKFKDLPHLIQDRIGSEAVFNKINKAFTKQDKWENLPRNVKDWFNERLMKFEMGTTWESVPQSIRDRIPKQVWNMYLEPRVGGLPYVQDVAKSFRAYVPLSVKKLHLDGFDERWSPIINSLPEGGPLTEGHYLRQYTNMIHGTDLHWGDKTLDGLIKVVEDQLGTVLADPKLLSRMASRGAAWTYRGTLGGDSAVINLSQSVNTWAAGGSSGFLRGLGRYLNGEARQRPDVGLVREFSNIYLKGEFTGAPKSNMGATRSLADLDDKITRLSLSPMAIAEHISRGIAWLTGMETAAARGASLTEAMQVGFANASKVVPNLEMAQATRQAISLVAETQFGYSPAYRSPYFAGPLGRASTMFMSYAFRQAQFLVNGIADGSRDVWYHPNFANAARLTRFLALTGLMVGGPILGKEIGVDLEGAFGLTNSLFRKSFAGPLAIITGTYNAITDFNKGEPLTNQKIDRAWDEAMKILVPQRRWGVQASRAWEASEKGYRVDDIGRRTYDTTPYGELLKTLGVDYGKAYKQKTLVQSIRRENTIRLDARKYALKNYIETQDESHIEEYNKKYPQLPITGMDVNAEMRMRAVPLAERFGPTYLRHQDEERTNSVGEAP